MTSIDLKVSTLEEIKIPNAIYFSTPPARLSSFIFSSMYKIFISSSCNLVCISSAITLFYVSYTTVTLFIFYFYFYFLKTKILSPLSLSFYAFSSKFKFLCNIFKNFYHSSATISSRCLQYFST